MLAALPWEGVGTRVEGADPEGILAQAGLGWRVALSDVYDREGRPIGRYKAVIREDTGATLGVVSSRWTPIQNSVLTRFASDLAAVAGARVEAAGASRAGRTVWALLAQPEAIRVAGDEVLPYMLVANSHDGSMALRVAPVAIRVACSNAIRRALASATGGVAVRHLGDVGSRLEAARDVLSYAARGIGRLQETAEELARRVMTEAELGAFADRLHPLPGGDAEAHPRILAARRSIVEKATGTGLGIGERLRGTAWGAYQAALEWEGHDRRYRNAGSRFDRLMLGPASFERRALELLRN